MPEPLQIRLDFDWLPVFHRSLTVNSNFESVTYQYHIVPLYRYSSVESDMRDLTDVT